MSRSKHPQWGATGMPPPQVPDDPHALAALHGTYQALHGEGRWHRWTREETVILGRLYVQAWGGVPTPWRMQQAYCLPDAGVIRRAWGTYAAYYAALDAP